MLEKRRGANDDPAAVATTHVDAAAAQPLERGSEVLATGRVGTSLGGHQRRPQRPLLGPTTVRRNDGRVYVTVGSDCYKLGYVQGSVLWQLVEAAARAFPWVQGSLLLERAGSRAGHLSQVFRSASKRPLLQLILSNHAGVYRIAPGRRVDGDTFEIGADRQVES